jgi:hypothetical protein
MLANWERFLHNPTELDPLIRMALSHAQAGHNLDVKL